MINCSDEKNIRFVVYEYADMITRIAFQYVKNKADAEDIMQEVFLALMKQAYLENQEHLKAWLIRVTINKSKNHIKAAKKRNAAPLEKAEYLFSSEQKNTLQEIDELPKKERDILYLFYYEGYTAKEIARILRKKEMTVFKLLSRAREKLKHLLEVEETKNYEK